MTRRRTGSQTPSRVVVAALVVGAMSACTSTGTTFPPEATTPATTTTVAPRVDDGVLTIGAWLPSTGPGAALGEPIFRAINAQISQINRAGGVLGNPVQLEFADENSETGLYDLINSDVDAIVGPASSLVALTQLGSITQPGSGLVSCSPTATALRLDDFPDNNYFFRTIPSDSLQMAAIAKRAQLTGVNSVSIGFLDDPYGRGLSDALTDQLSDRRIGIVKKVGFSADEQDLSFGAAELLADNPGLIVVLADADDGGRILSALNNSVGDGVPPSILVNDSLSGAGQTIQQLPRSFREQVIGVAPPALSREDPSLAPYAANASDCVTLIALAATQVGTDNPTKLRSAIAAVSSGGRVCTSFADCAKLVDDGLNIDYNGLSGTLELATTSGDPQRATFDIFQFGADGKTSVVSAIDV